MRRKITHFYYIITSSLTLTMLAHKLLTNYYRSAKEQIEITGGKKVYNTQE